MAKVFTGLFHQSGTPCFVQMANLRDGRAASLDLILASYWTCLGCPAFSSEKIDFRLTVITKCTLARLKYMTYVWEVTLN